MTYRERRQRRADRLRGWAGKRQQKAAVSFQAADERAAAIPMGQPILVGHHSERRHGRDVERIEHAMAQGFEHQKKAASMESRADEIQRQADRSIYRDDPDAIAQLEDRIAALETQRARRMQINREIRRGAGWERRMTPPLTDDERADLMRAAQFSGCQGYPPYSLQNLSSNIARQRARLAELRQRDCARQVNAETPADENPIADFAAALNPAGGALGIDAPFSLTAETPDECREQQPDLFGDDDQ